MPQLGGITSIAFSPDGDRLATASYSNWDIRVWSLPSGEELMTLSGHTDNISCIAFNPDGEQIVSGGSDRLFRFGRHSLARKRCR